MDFSLERTDSLFVDFGKLAQRQPSETDERWRAIFCTEEGSVELSGLLVFTLEKQRPCHELTSSPVKTSAEILRLSGTTGQLGSEKGTPFAVGARAVYIKPVRQRF